MRRLRFWMRDGFFAGLLIFNGGHLFGATPAGAIGPAGSSEPSISGDGRFVAFTSAAALVAEDTNKIGDVYVMDRSTGALRKVSDARGGDTPLVSADGRTVLYRGMAEFPMVRRVDLSLGTPPSTVSHALGVDDTPSTVSFRYAENFAASPDGRFVAFPYIAAPGLNTQGGTLLCLTDSTVTDPANSSASYLGGALLKTGGRVALSPTGDLFFETSDSLFFTDTNAAQDIYFVHAGQVQRSRVSVPDTNDRGGAHHPAVSNDGGTLFFLTEQPLHLHDPAQASYLYVCAGPDFQTTQVVPTAVQPLALSRQATGTGKYVVFLGMTPQKVRRSFIVRLSDGMLATLATSAPAVGGEPAISADDSQVAVVDGKGQITVVANPLLLTAAPAPVPVLSGASDKQVFSEGGTLNLSATATVSSGIVGEVNIEFDGSLLPTQVNGNSVQASVTNLEPGPHSIRALALSGFAVPGASAPITITVTPASDQLEIAGISQLQRAGDSGQATTFSAMVNLANTTGLTSGQTQLVVSETPIFYRWLAFTDGDQPATSVDEQVLGTFASGNVQAGTSATFAVSGTTSAAETVAPENILGIGWSVHVRLQELVGSDWVDRGEPVELFQVQPLLDEQTAGPNGGVLSAGTSLASGTFAPAQVTSIAIANPPSAPQQPPPIELSELASHAYPCTAHFSNGTAAACSPVWSIVSGGAYASISSTGVVTGKRVTAARQVSLQAAFAGKTATLVLTIKPVSPVLSARLKKNAVKPATEGTIRIMRTPLTAGSVAVNYEVSGTAVPADSMDTNHGDYTALSGTATIEANRSFVDVPVEPLETGAFIGSRSVTLTLQPSSDYRLAAAHAATLLIADDQPVPPGQPDATIQLGAAPPVGANVYFTKDPTDQGRTPQTISTNAVLNQVRKFTISAVNRTASPQAFTVQGAASGVGFSVRYLYGTKDVTAQVEAGSFQFPRPVAPKGAAQLHLVVKPTSDTPVGQQAVCAVTITGFSLTDQVEAIVTRSR